MSVKPDIVFIHGMWSRPTVWAPWVSFFHRLGYNCHAIELPGHEAQASDSLLRGKSLQHYVDAVAALAMRLQRPVLIGHSLGGLIGQLVAQQVEVAGLVMVNSAAPGQVFPLRPSMLPGLVRHFSQWGLWRKAFRLSRWEANYLVFNRVAVAERASLYDLLIAESGRVAYEVGFGRLNPSQSNCVRKERIACPMLALAGGRDRIIPRSVSRGTARWYGAQLEYREYPDNGHWLLGETGWSQRALEVAEWISQRCSAPTGLACGAL